MQPSISWCGLIVHLVKTIDKLNKKTKILEHEKNCVLDQLQYTQEQFELITGKNMETKEFQKLETDESQIVSDSQLQEDENITTTEQLSNESQDQSELQQEQRQIEEPLPFTITLRQRRRQLGEFKELGDYHSHQCKCSVCHFEKLNKKKSKKNMKRQKKEK